MKRFHFFNKIEETTLSDNIENIRIILIKEILAFYNGKTRHKNKDELLKKLNEIIKKYKVNEIEKTYLDNLINSEINTFGPLDKLMQDNSIKRIMVNSYNDVYVSINEQNIKVDNIFINSDHMFFTLRKILKREVEDSIINIKREDFEITVLSPPVCKTGIVFTINKTIKSNVDSAYLIKNKIINNDMLNFFEAIIDAKLNIIICGNRNSGKSMLLKVLLELINDKERIVLIENKDNIELNKDNIIKLSNDYKENQNLIDYAIKLKPDRLAIDSLSLNNTYYIIEAIDLGYKGIIGTINSDSTEDSIDKIKRDILLKDSSYDDKKLLEVVSQSIDILINIKELRDNNKKVIEISEVDKKTLKIKKIFTFKETGLDLEGNIVGKYIINNEAKIYDYLKENNIIKADYLFNKSKVVIKENDIEEFNPVSKKTAQEKRKEYYRKVLDKKNKEKKKLKKKAQSK